MQVPDLQYTSLLTHWMTFVVVTAVTAVLLISFEGLGVHFWPADVQRTGGEVGRRTRVEDV